MNHSSPSNVVYKALPLRNVPKSSSIGMVHKGTPIRSYIPPKPHKVDPPKSIYVTPKPASYITPLPNQIRSSHEKPLKKSKPAVLYGAPGHSLINRRDDLTPFKKVSKLSE